MGNFTNKIFHVNLNLTLQATRRQLGYSARTNGREINYAKLQRFFTCFSGHKGEKSLNALSGLQLVSAASTSVLFYFRHSTPSLFLSLLYENTKEKKWHSGVHVLRHCLFQIHKKSLSPSFNSPRSPDKTEFSLSLMWPISSLNAATALN